MASSEGNLPNFRVNIILTSDDGQTLTNTIHINTQPAPPPLSVVPTPLTMVITWPRPWPTIPPRRLRLIEADIPIPAVTPDWPGWRDSGWHAWKHRTRKWTQRKLEIQNEVDDAFASGVKLWTRQMLLDAESEVAKTQDSLYNFYPFNKLAAASTSEREFQQEPWDKRSLDTFML